LAARRPPALKRPAPRRAPPRPQVAASPGGGSGGGGRASPLGAPAAGADAGPAWRPVRRAAALSPLSASASPAPPAETSWGPRGAPARAPDSAGGAEGVDSYNPFNVGTRPPEEWAAGARPWRVLRGPAAAPAAAWSPSEARLMFSAGRPLRADEGALVASLKRELSEVRPPPRPPSLPY
jgi:hypothetical protein